MNTHTCMHMTSLPRCTELPMPSAQSTDCENAACAPQQGMWSGQWQVPTQAECPVCSSTYPVVNALAFGREDDVLWFGGYGRQLHRWGAISAVVAQCETPTDPTDTTDIQGPPAPLT